MALGLGAFAAVDLLASSTPPGQVLAETFARDWTRAGYSEMYSLLGAGRPSLRGFVALERHDARSATVTAATAGRATALGDGRFSVPLRIDTAIFGTLEERLTVATATSNGGLAIRWSARLAFPGLRAGEALRRVDDAPRRGILLSRDGGPLSAVAAASNVIGDVGRASGAQLAQLEAEGFPRSTPVGLDGLELVFQPELGGRPGGRLYEGSRLLATAAPVRGQDVYTSISPTLQTLAAGELSANLPDPENSAIIAMEPADGELLAAAGVPLSELQPPGSTFKIITLTGVLEAHLAGPASVFPDATSTTIDGYVLHNSDDEDCGGTLANAFAVSCNSVFAPLGVELGSHALVRAALRYGFDAPSPIAIAAESTIPPASAMADRLVVGSSAIGQGQVLASPLQMLRVAGTIALVGRRPLPTFALAPDRRFPRVIPVAVARTIRAMMRDVVLYGTGTAAQIPGVAVAGKTGTAQVAVPQCPTGATGASGPTGASGASGASGATGATGAASCSTVDDNPYDTDAWFVAFAPEYHPRIVVAVLLPHDGAGGTSAAPIARAVIEEALALTR